MGVYGEVEEENQRLFNSVLCGIIRYTADAGSQIIEINQAGLNIYGYGSREEFLEYMNQDISRMAYPYDSEIFRGFRERCVKTGQQVNFGYRILRKDKTISYIMGNLQCITLADGSCVLQSIFTETVNRVLNADAKKSLLYQTAIGQTKLKTLILADNHHQDEQQMRDILEEDYEIITVHSGKEILSVLEKKNQDIAAILVDVEILRQDNNKLMAALKGNVLYASVPFILLADQGDGDDETLLCGGANEFFRKPFCRGIIKLRLANMIELRSMAVQKNSVEAVMDNLPGGIMICRMSNDFRVLYASDGVLELIGRSRQEYQEIIKKSLAAKIIHAQDVKRVFTKIKEAAVTERRLEMTFRVIHRDGHAVWVHLHAKKIRRDKEGLVYQAIVMPTTETERMYKNVLDDFFNGIIVRSVESDELLYMNNEAARLGQLTGVCGLEFDVAELSWEKFFVKQMIPKNSRRHLTMSGKLIDWNGIEATIIYITDDTERYRALTERHELYESEMSKRVSLEDSLLGAAIYNATKDSLVEFNLKQRLSLSLTEGMSLQDIVSGIVMKIEDPAERQLFENTFSAEHMIYNYQRGFKKKGIQFRFRSSCGKKWLGVSYSLIEHPTTGDVLSFVYIRDINDDMVTRTAFSQTINMEMEYVLCLDIQSGKIRLLNIREGITFPPRDLVMDYEDYVEYSLQNSVDEDELASVREKLKPEVICKVLEQEQVYTVLYKRQNSDGSLVVKKVRLFYLDEDKQLICFIRSDITDIYEQQQLQTEKLEQALQNAKQANSAKSMFLSRMSHEIRTPMNAVLGMAELALEEPDKSDIIEDYLGKIYSSGQYLLGLLNDILDMSKIESERVKLYPEPYYLKDCISFVMVSMESQIQADNISFEYKEDSHDGIMVDRMRTQQIFFNLISNAVKFTPSGGKIRIEVTTLWKKEGRLKYRIVVEDSGVGIRPDERERVFEAFEQGEPKKSNSQGGTGLGLAIVRNLIHLMKGKIWVEDSALGGAAFIMEMEMVRFDGKEQEARQLEAVPEEYDFSGNKILVVEDHAINMEIMKKLLLRKKCTVTGAENGQEALELFRNSKPGEYSAILMDVRMPVMDGIEATRLIRQLKHPDAAGIPIIAMTADAFEEDARRTKGAGMNAHLSKPIIMERLYQTLYEFLCHEGEKNAGNS